MIICENCIRAEYYVSISSNDRTLVKENRDCKRYLRCFCARHYRASSRRQTRGDSDLIL